MNIRNFELWKDYCTKLHNGKYDYSQVIYKKARDKVEIICPIHGSFWITASSHRTGCGCIKCGWESMKKKLKHTIEEIKEKIDEKYNGIITLLPNLEYINNKQLLHFNCHIHGEFASTYNIVLKTHGCPKCGRLDIGNKLRKTDCEYRKIIKELDTNNLVELINDEKYENIGSKLKHKFLCNKHKIIYEITISNLMTSLKKGYNGCKLCAAENAKKGFASAEEVEKLMIEKHKGIYTYDISTYISKVAKMRMYCMKHGEFWQAPKLHLQGQGCPKCKKSKMELALMEYLDNHNINYISLYRINWLNLLSIDFYLIDYNVGIECQGKLHFEIIPNFKGEAGYKHRQILDVKKYNLCNEYKLKLFYYTNILKYNTFLDEPLYHDFDELMQAIKLYAQQAETAVQPEVTTETTSAPNTDDVQDVPFEEV